MVDIVNFKKKQGGIMAKQTVTNCNQLSSPKTSDN